MRIIHSCRTYYPDPPGGLQEAIRQISGVTRDRGFDPVVFALSSQPTPEFVSYPEADVVRRRSWIAPASTDIGGLASFREYARLARKSHILHYHFPWPFSDLLNQAAPYATPRVMTYHSDIVRQRALGKLYSPLMWRTLRSMNVIVATSEAYVASSPVLSHPTIRDKVRVIPLGIEESRHRSTPDLGIFNRTGVRKEAPYFLFVGVLRYYKGLQHLIQASSSVSAPIIIAGTGPEQRSLRALAKAKSARNVIFTGHVTNEEKHALISHSRAFVFPSYLRSEAFGMSLVEASMHGRPMISCEIGTGTTFVNQHNETGLVIPAESPSDLAAAMRLLLDDAELAVQLGRRARNRYEQLFSGSTLGSAYSDLYREVAAANQSELRDVH